MRKIVCDREGVWEKVSVCDEICQFDRKCVYVCVKEFMWGILWLWKRLCVWEIGNASERMYLWERLYVREYVRKRMCEEGCTWEKAYIWEWVCNWGSKLIWQNVFMWRTVWESLCLREREKMCLRVGMCMNEWMFMWGYMWEREYQREKESVYKGMCMSRTLCLWQRKREREYVCNAHILKDCFFLYLLNFYEDHFRQ